ncbi:DUF2958 domain-containing protein [Alicyclobacillus tolerans]|uniref:DUF2958 domain-containing protein n=1 Tax=Alicyclobacillus tolerans TaxID=90970 RepID=UPI001F2CEC60|nr:DUF2958 domain-containing protein [Alicyclobacillus tolerans]MCF8568158.1 DUF2958 domain-containing protein [Alicyclobacillus tolerans]
MTLWTSELRTITPPLYGTEETPVENKLITTKFFAPACGFTWYVAEYEAQEDGNVLFFGYVDNATDPWCSEWGYFTLHELESLRWNGIPQVERDLHFSPIQFQTIHMSSRS